MRPVRSIRYFAGQYSFAYARQVHLVVGGRGKVEVLLDGRRRRTVEIAGEPRLYTLLELPKLSEGLLELRFTPGLAAYAFTFG